jgi:hypothetical protein
VKHAGMITGRYVMCVIYLSVHSLKFYNKSAFTLYTCFYLIIIYQIRDSDGAECNNQQGPCCHHIQESYPDNGSSRFT